MNLTPEAVVAIAGWLCGVLLVFIGWRKIPDWVKERQARALADPEDVARVALSQAVKEDVVPIILAQAKAQITASEVRLAQIVGAVEARLTSELAGFKTAVADLQASVTPIQAQVADLAPLGRMVPVQMEDGSTQQRLALQMTLNSTIDALNGLIDWISAEPPAPGLSQTFENTLIRVKEHDVMAAMGAKGNEAQRQAAEAMGIKAADQLAYLQAHPEAAQMGMELKESEDALNEILGMMGVKTDGAIGKWAMGAAKRRLGQQAMGGLVQGRGGPPSGGFQPM